MSEKHQASPSPNSAKLSMAEFENEKQRAVSYKEEVEKIDIENVLSPENFTQTHVAEPLQAVAELEKAPPPIAANYTPHEAAKDNLFNMLLEDRYRLSLAEANTSLEVLQKQLELFQTDFVLRTMFQKKFGHIFESQFSDVEQNILFFTWRHCKTFNMFNDEIVQKDYPAAVAQILKEKVIMAYDINSAPTDLGSQNSSEDSSLGYSSEDTSLDYSPEDTSVVDSTEKIAALEASPQTSSIESLPIEPSSIESLPIEPSTFTEIFKVLVDILNLF